LSVPFLLNSTEIVPGALVALVQTVRDPSDMGAASIAQGAIAVLFDQEYGVLPFAPVLLMGFAGLVGMLRERPVRVAALVLGIGSLLVVLMAASMDPWWSEEMMPGRTAILLLPLLGPPTAWLYERLRGHPGLASGARFLLLTTLSVSIVTVVLHDRIRLPQEADGSSSLLEWMSPTWHLWAAAPTFLESAFLNAFVRSLVWLAALAVAAWLLSRLKPVSPARAALWTTCGALALFMLTAAGTAVLPANGRPVKFDLQGRALLPLLENFDPVARPVALRFDPFSVVPSSELPSMFSLNALPGQRVGRQPVHVLLNARFRLPAGEYEAVVEGSGAPPRATIGLQVGRSGTTLETWPLTAAPGNPARYRFTLPLDADFVGFRTSRQAERTVTAFHLRPVSVVETRQRFHTPGVRSAASWGHVKVFFHDANAYPESEGFWVRGESTTGLTLLKANPQDESVTLALHCGLRANLATLSSGRWTERIDLVPGTTTTVVVPSVPGEQLVRLSIASRDGFVPSQIDRESRDRRSLGVWVAFPPLSP
jgi:hypothetical protein